MGSFDIGHSVAQKTSSQKYIILSVLITVASVPAVNLNLFQPPLFSHVLGY